MWTILLPVFYCFNFDSYVLPIKKSKQNVFKYYNISLFLSHNHPNLNKNSLEIFLRKHLYCCRWVLARYHAFNISYNFRINYILYQYSVISQQNGLKYLYLHLFNKFKQRVHLPLSTSSPLSPLHSALLLVSCWPHSLPSTCPRLAPPRASRRSLVASANLSPTLVRKETFHILDKCSEKCIVALLLLQRQRNVLLWSLFFFNSNDSNESIVFQHPSTSYFVIFLQAVVQFQDLLINTLPVQHPTIDGEMSWWTWWSV